MRHPILFKEKKIEKRCKIKIQNISFVEKENMVKIILDKKPDLIDLKTDEGYTPLSMTVQKNGKFSSDFKC